MGSAACGLAPTLGWLIAGRVLQGVGGAALSPGSLSVLAAAFPIPRERAQALGIWSGVSGVALAAGPLLGGVLIQLSGWQAIFFVNLPIGVIAFFLGLRVLAESRNPAARGLDILGQTLAIGVLGTFKYALIEGQADGWGSPLIVGLLVVAGVLLIAFLGVAGGMMVGAAIALLREGGDHTFRRAEQIESATGLPVMAMVPQVAGRTPPAMQVLRQPTSAYSEALRRLHIGVELSEAATSPKTILFSSATPSEGKSVMVASLGRLLASNGKRVLLVDCYWRSPRLHQIFRFTNRDGLASLLVDKEAQLEDVIHHDALSGVDVMPAGPWSPRSAHLLGSDHMRHLLEALEPHYEFILLDTPPALVTADVLALSRLVEKVVFVVRWGHTRQEAVLEALKQIIDAQGDVAGVVMSRVVSKQYRQYSYGDPFFEGSRSGAATR